MRNLKWSRSGNKVTVEIDLHDVSIETGDMSRRGSSVVLASTDGNVRIDPKRKIDMQINVFVPIKEALEQTVKRD